MFGFFFIIIFVFAVSSKARRLKKVQSNSNGGVSVDIRVDNTILNGLPIVSRAENEYTSNYRGEKNGPLQDEESRGKGDVGANNTKAGEDVYEELDERYIQPQPEKGNWRGKPDKGISSPNAEGAEYDELNDRHLQPSQTAKGKWQGKQDKRMSTPKAGEEEYDDVEPQNDKSKSHGKQEMGKYSPEAGEDEYDDVEDAYLLPQSVNQGDGQCSPEAGKNRPKETYLHLKHDDVTTYGKRDMHMGSPGAGEMTYERIRDVDDPKNGQDQLPVYDDTV